MIMICQNCNAHIDNDLIFCTDCGQRLMQTQSDAPTIVDRTQKQSETPTVVNPQNSRLTTPSESPAKKKSLLWLWILLGLFIFTLPAVMIASWLIFWIGKSAEPVSNVKPKPTATVKKTPTPIDNKTANVNLTNSNTNAVDTANATNTTNTNTTSKDNIENSTPKDIFNDQIELGAGEHKAIPFTVDISNLTKIFGNVETVQGDSVQYFVYTEDAYKSFFPDANFKLFGDDGKSHEVDQFLPIKGEYVLIFQNKTDKPVTVKGKIGLKPNEINL